MDKCILAEQCNENSINIATPSWWPDVHASSICSWNNGVNYASNPNPCNNNNPQNPNSNCSNGEEDASNNSGLSMESSRRLVEKSSTNDPYGEAVSDNHHLWNQVLRGVGTTTAELQNISTRTGMFERACDYLKKIDNGWEYSSPTNLNHFLKEFDSYNDGQHHNKNLDSRFNQFNGQFAALKNENTADIDIDREGLFRRGFNSHAIEYQMGISNMVISDMECNNGSRSGFLDLVAFGSCLNKPPSDHSNTTTKINGRGNGVVNEGKRKKSEHQSGSLLKKTKLDNSTVSSTKVQVPKAKLGDKITALQQIVSPFGKTDTASVLWEAIGYIKCLQEQVQLLSNPYMKTNVIKDKWGRLETKERDDRKIDLKSRGLCLVPVSCTPQVYHENNGSDYWTPTYRGCFYR